MFAHVSIDDRLVRGAQSDCARIERFQPTRVSCQDYFFLRFLLLQSSIRREVLCKVTFESLDRIGTKAN